jgi:CMP-N-acetylneuraminic acid synthetase
MLRGKSVLAVVPARSGSKGIPNKNMQPLKGVSLIGWAGKTLSRLPFIDARVIFTDSPEYAQEGQRYGLEVPFPRPAYLSTDQVGAIETIQYVLTESERHYNRRFDIILLIEPTSPLRAPEDIERVTVKLVESGADSVVAVSPFSEKAHPRKMLVEENGRLGFLLEGGNEIKARQSLIGNYYWRNGVCYALTRECLMDKGVIFAENTLPDIMTRPVVNIDEPIDLEWAEFLLTRQQAMGHIE